MLDKRRFFRRGLAAALLACAAGLGISGAWNLRPAKSGLLPAGVGAAGVPDAAEPRRVTSGLFGAPAPAGFFLAAGALSPAPALFSFVVPPDAQALEAALNAPSLVSGFVEIDRALIESKESPFWQAPGKGRLLMPLPGGGSIAVAIDRSEMMGPRRFTSLGRIEGRAGSRVVFGYNEGFLHAAIEDDDLGSYVLATATTELNQIYKLDPAKVPPCGGERFGAIDADAIATLAARKASAAAAGFDEAGSEPGPAVASAAAAGANIEVHLLMAYTQAVLSTVAPENRSAAVQAAFDSAVAQVNSDFENSLVAVRVRLVRIAQVIYNGDEAAFGAVDWQGDMLETLRRTTDSASGTATGSTLNEIHALRDESGADLVCLVQKRGDPGSVGIGFVLQPPSDNTNPLFGFSVINYDFITFQHVLSHELGHNFGCVHNRENTEAPGAHSYSYGYRVTANNGRLYHDIMAYATSGNQFGADVRLPYFSTPLVTPSQVGRPIGIPAGAPGEADTARTIDETAFEVGNFRLQTRSVSNAGNLVNVSTRAFAGTDARQLIGGFVITGTQSKTMLIRAAGPALEPAGVPNFLQNPQLTLVRSETSQVMGTNDNWQSSNGAAIAAAAAQVGAFPFASGSLDSALLITLPPGAYTALVNGANGTTGEVLVEAYEVDRNSNRVVNLSTRGYVTPAVPMIGGFVVQGSVGTTKRMLIRVRGPSLTSAGVSGVLDDPTFTLHNSERELIYTNDDWSTGNIGGNDNNPSVTQYNEVQISATGYAPGNRRESAVMADLAPGPYTVIVRPFSSATQPAQPGIAIVEVFEINP